MALGEMEGDSIIVHHYLKRSNNGISGVMVVMTWMGRVRVGFATSQILFCLFAKMNSGTNLKLPMLYFRGMIV